MFPTLALAALLALVPLGLAAQAGAVSPPPATLNGVLTNLRGRGICYLALFASAEGFPKQTSRAVRTSRIPEGGANVLFAFYNLPPGDYALAVFYDENNNGRLDTNLLGIPTEQFGFSNNARRMMFFPPSFAAARFAVPAAARVSVKLR